MTAPMYPSFDPNNVMGSFAQVMPGLEQAGSNIALPNFDTAAAPWYSGFLGGTDPATGMKTDGWGMPAIQGIAGLGNAWMGMQQYGLAKDQLSFQKEAFNKNFGVQKQMVNSQLEDRQRARVASNPGAYESVGGYMNQNGVK